MAWTGMHLHSATDGFVMELCLHTNVRIAMVLQGNTFETFYDRARIEGEGLGKGMQ